MNQRMYMQIRSGADYWVGSNSDSHPTHPVFWSEIRHVTQEVNMDIAGVNSSGGPQASGRIAHEDMIVLKDVDRMTPKFYDAACRGAGIDVIIEIFDLTDDRSKEPVVANLKPDYLYILRGVSITGQKITNARTVFERREYNLANATGTENEMLTGFTDVGWTSPRTIARETLQFLYSDLLMEIYGPVNLVRSRLCGGFWDATKNSPLPKDGYRFEVTASHAYKDDEGKNATLSNGRFYSW